MAEKRHIYGLDAQDIDCVISFMTKNQSLLSIAEKEVLIHLVDLRYNTKGTELT